MHRKLSCAIFLISFNVLSFAGAKTLVFEYKPASVGLKHVEDVLWSACRDKSDKDCESIYAEEFDADLFKNLRSVVEQFDVVNMSFGQVSMTDHELMIGEAMDASFSATKYLEKFNEENQLLKSFIEDSRDTLFTAAAGNGKRTFLGPVEGVALSSSYQLFPASFDFENLISVAALEKSSIDYEDLENHKLAIYSNFSVFNVDMAAAPSRDAEGEVLLGTSFAAPYVARVSQKIRDLSKEVAPKVVKEILMKSSYVVKIDEAIAASRDFNKYGKDSDLYKVHLLVVKEAREKMLKSLGGITLVKSGGFLVEPVAIECAKLYFSSGMSVNEACLQSHATVLSADKDRLEALGELWSVRGF